MDQVLLFTKQDYVYGQNIVINFKIPNNFSSTIEVIKTVNIGRNSKIISASKMDYRILGKFLFKFPQERENLRNFLSSIEPDIPEPPKALKKAEVEDDDDDDFDDLGF